MKVLVGVKRVVDANVKVRVKLDYSNVDIEHSKMSLNPFDENAIEESVQLKEKGIVSEIVALSIGSSKCIETLRIAIARGCDRAILVEIEEELEPILVANIFAQVVKKELPDIIMLGKQAIDDDANQVGQMLAGILDYPQATFVSNIEVENNKIIATREIDNGTELVRLSLPAVITADLYLNEPRFIKLPQLMLAKKKDVEIIKFNDLGIEYKKNSRIIKAIDGEIKKNCKYLNSINEVQEILKILKIES
jgi:electron transfer flavoprotein beta subunit